MAYIIDAALDAAVQYIATNTTHLYITSAEAANYNEASNTLKLGTKAGPAFTGPADGTPNGRQTQVNAITDGTVDADGTAAFWALTTGSVLLATGALGSSQAVVNGNTFTLTAFTVRVPDAA